MKRVIHSFAFRTLKIGSFIILWLILFLTEIGLIVPLSYASSSLLIFAGAASKPPTEEITKIFAQKKGVIINTTYGGSGFVLAQMKLARKGDVYFPGSADFMEKAKKEQIILPETEKIIVYLIPAINVQRGNPRQIRTLKDLTKPGLRLAIADPENVCVGTFAVEIIEKNLNLEEKHLFRKNLVNIVESCEKTANIISLKGVDAVLGWRVFQHWDAQRIETILLRPDEVPRIGYIPAAISVYSKNRQLASEFIASLLSPESQAIFKKHGYLTTMEEARRYTLWQTPVGGEYFLPISWKRNKK